MQQVVLGKLYRQINKNTMMTSSCHLILLRFENLKVCAIEYSLSSLLVLNLLASWIELYEGYQPSNF